MKASFHSCYLCAPLLSLWLISCATIFNGMNQRIPVIGPNEPVLIENNGTPLVVYQRPDSSRYVEIPRKKAALITTTYKGLTDSLLLESTLQEGWIIPALFTYGVSAVIDDATGSWKSFGDPIIIYGYNDSTLQAAKVNVIRRRILRLEEFDSSQFKYPYHPIGAHINVTFGMNSFTEQTPLFFANLGILVGYNFNKYFSSSLNYDANSCIDCVDYQGDIRSTGNCDIGIEHFVLILRGEIEGLYIGVHGGYSDINSNTMKNILTGKKTEGFSAQIPAFGWSIGYRGSVGFIEYRRLYGTQRFTVGEDATAGLRTYTLRGGLGVTF